MHLYAICVGCGGKVRGTVLLYIAKKFILNQLLSVILSSFAIISLLKRAPRGQNISTKETIL